MPLISGENCPRPRKRALAFAIAHTQVAEMQTARRVVIAAMLLLGLSPNLSFATVGGSGDLDPAFGNHGIAELITQPQFFPFTPNMAFMGDGRIQVAVTGQTAAGASAVAIARLTGNGQIDSTYRSGQLGVLVPKQGSYVNATAILPDGQVYALANSGTDTLLVGHVLASGAVDSQFGVGGWAAVGSSSLANMSIVAAHVTKDGTILFCGTTTPSGQPQAFVGIFNPQDRSVVTATPLSMDLQTSSANTCTESADGNLVLAGGAKRFSGVSNVDWFAARVTPALALDPTFNAAGIAPGILQVSASLGINYDDYLESVVLDATGAAYAGGNVLGAGQSEDFGFLKIGADGTPAVDFGFDANGVVALPIDAGTSKTEHLQAVARQRSGKIVAAGYADEHISPLLKQLAVVRIDSSGQLDAAFGTGAGRSIIPLSTPGAPSAVYGTRVALALDVSDKPTVAVAYGDDFSSDSIKIFKFYEDQVFLGTFEPE